MRVAYRNLLAVILLAGAFAMTLVHARGPAPRPASAPPDLFSAERAAGVLAQLVGDGIPHPVGSAAHAAVRDRIVARLRRLGYRPSVESGFACSSLAVCAPVENITAVIPGSANGPAVMLSAHYDSVPAGPGASDDGSGVAALLEIARVLAAEPPRRNPVLLLFDDGEEAGLIGAEWFVAKSALVRQVAVVVNLDARGTRGESFMFETTPGHRWLIELMARSVERPDSSSLFYEIYKRLPNDTDLTVFKRAGKEGLNFSFLGNVSAYHTPLDRFAQLSLRSLQHQGDNGLAMARALAAADLGQRHRGELVWFDLFSLIVIRWPLGWTLPMGAGSLLLALTAIVLARRRDATFVRRAARGLWWFLSVLLVSAVATAVILAVVRLHSGSAAWPAHPGGAIAAAWLAGLLVPIGLAALFGRRAGDSGLAAGAAVGWSVLAAATSWLLPGASYLFLPVAILLSLSLFAEGRALGTLAAILRLLATALSAAILFFCWTLYDALGLLSLLASGLFVALVSTTWCSVVAAWPRSAPRIVSASLAILIVASAGWGALQPVYTVSSPQGLNLILYVDADSRSARWLTAVRRQDLPSKLLRAARWSDARPFPWYSRDSFSTARAPMPSPAAPRVDPREEVTARGRNVSLHLHSAQGVDRLILNLHDGGRLEAAGVNGWHVTPFSERYRSRLSPGWTRIVVLGGGDVQFDLAIRGRERIEAVIEEQTYGLPSSAAWLIAARAPAAVSSNSGDGTIVRRNITF
jgi:hypothetical protein